MNRSKNPDFPYWNYERFELDELTNAECNAEFRFYKNDIYKLADALQLSDEFVTYNGLIVKSVPVLCIYLKRFSYPYRYSDMVFHFARPVPEICIMTNHTIEWIYNRWNHLLTTYHHNLLSPANLMLYADAVHQSGAALDSCWGFIDGTVRSVCRPGVNQRVLYNGHKRVHSIKFQSVALPSGLVGHLYGPVEERRHDSSRSGLLQELQRFSNSPITGTHMCVYGDPAYPLRAHLQRPFRDAALTQDQKNYNTAMNGARTAVEWVFWRHS